MNFIKIIQLAMQAIAMADSIRQAVRSGQSVLELLKEKGPALIEFISEIGKTLFPGLSAEDTITAGAQAQFDRDGNIWLQTSLNKLMNAKLAVDGEYGPLTKAAVEAFQKANKLDVDGWAGPQTIAAITAALAK